MIKKIVFSTLLVILAIASAIHLLLEGSCTDAEIHRVASPNNSIEAVISTRECGATTGTAYFVSLVTPKISPGKNDHVAVMDDVENLKILWIDDNKLSASYDEARFYDLKSSFNVNDQEVQIEATKNTK